MEGLWKDLNMETKLQHLLQTEFLRKKSSLQTQTSLMHCALGSEQTPLGPHGVVALSSVGTAGISK